MSLRENRRRGIGFGKEQFPHRPSQRIKETTYVTCQQCGFAIDTTTTGLSKSGEEPADGGGNGACPLCRSRNWAPSKRRLIDGSFSDVKRSDRRRLR